MPDTSPQSIPSLCLQLYGITTYLRCYGHGKLLVKSSKGHYLLERRTVTGCLFSGATTSALLCQTALKGSRFPKVKNGSEGHKEVYVVSQKALPRALKEYHHDFTKEPESQNGREGARSHGNEGDHAMLTYRVRPR